MSTRSDFHPRTLARGLAWDVGLPLVAYYGLHLAGVGDWAALLVATSAAAARIGWVAVREGTLNLFATVMLLVFGLGLGLTFLSGDARFLLLKASIVTAAVGTTFLITGLRGRRPLTLAAQQSWSPARAAELAHEYRTDPLTRRAHRVSSTVWGLGLLSEAILRVPLIYLLPITIMVGLSTAMMVATFGGLIMWQARYVARLRRRSGVTLAVRREP